MPAATDFPARGKITSTGDGKVTFCPLNSNYQLHLLASGTGIEASDTPIQGFIRVNARKVYTVPSGGNFIQPIFGSPRIIQGRVKYVDEKIVVVQAGVPIIALLPSADSAIDLDEGQIAVGHLVNVVALPGATFAPAASVAGASAQILAGSALR